MMETRSRPVPSPIPLSEFLLAAAIALGVLAILSWDDPGGLNIDPDSYMRLVRFRDGYGIFHGGFIPRDNAPYGRTALWTMPFDGALAFFYTLGRAFAGPSGALYFAARVVSPFFCVTVGPLMFFGLRPFFPLRARVVMAVLAASAPGLLTFSFPGDADHHAMIVWLSVLFVIALTRYLFLDRLRYWHAAAAGIAAAVALWTNLEEFVVVATGLSALALHRCMVERPTALDTRVTDLVFSGAFSLTLTAAWLVDSPYEGLWATEVDRLSIVYVSFAWLFSAALIGLNAYLSKRATFSQSRNLLVAALLGGAAFLCWVAIEPDILQGPYAQFDRALYGLLIDHNAEMQPIWRPSPLALLDGLSLILIWISLAVLIAKTSGLQRRLWLACAILMIPISLMGIRFHRSMYFAEVLGSIPLGLVLAQHTRLDPKYRARGALAALTSATLAVYIVADLRLYLATPSHEKYVAAVEVCGPRSLSEALGPIVDTDAIVMAEFDLAPMVLYLSPNLRTVAAAAGYSRNMQGVLDVVSFFDAHNDDEARAILDKRGVTYVLICDTGRERLANFFFGDRILHDTPVWLQQVRSSSPPPTVRLYRVHPRDG